MDSITVIHTLIFSWGNCETCSIAPTILVHRIKDSDITPTIRQELEKKHGTELQVDFATEMTDQLSWGDSWFSTETKNLLLKTIEEAPTTDVKVPVSHMYYFKCFSVDL